MSWFCEMKSSTRLPGLNPIGLPASPSLSLREPRVAPSMLCSTAPPDFGSVRRRKPVASARAWPSGPKSTGLGGKPTVSDVTGLIQITVGDGWVSVTATPRPA